jgi:hypothetical protein
LADYFVVDVGAVSHEQLEQLFDLSWRDLAVSLLVISQNVLLSLVLSIKDVANPCLGVSYRAMAETNGSNASVPRASPCSLTTTLFYFKSGGFLVDGASDQYSWIFHNVCDLRVVQIPWSPCKPA